MKAICFDLNKTLIQENSWRHLNLMLGVTPTEDDVLMSWGQRGIISDKEGQQILLKIYQQSGKHSFENISNILHTYTYMFGAQEIINYAKSRGYTPLLISGSMDVLVERVAKELGIEHWRANNTFKFDESGFLKDIETLDNDKHTKLVQLKSLSEDLGFKMEETICVGDGDNDIEIFEATHHGVTFKGSKIENKAWKVINDLRDFKEII